MPVRKEVRGKKSVWVVDVLYRHPFGRRERVRRILPSDSRRSAAEFERKLRDLVGERKHLGEPKQVPTLAEFSVDFMATYAATNNKPSEVDSKKVGRFTESFHQLKQETPHARPLSFHLRL